MDDGERAVSDDSSVTCTARGDRMNGVKNELVGTEVTYAMIGRRAAVDGDVCGAAVDGVVGTRRGAR